MAEETLQLSQFEEAARLVIEIKNSKPIEVSNFTNSLSGIAKEYEARLKSNSPSIISNDTQLLIVEVRKGSIIFELAATISPLLGGVETINTLVDFAKNTKESLSILSRQNGRLPDATTSQLKNFGDAVRLIATDATGSIDIYAKHQNGEILEEFAIRRDDAKNIVANTSAQRRELESRSSNIYHHVLMRLHQTSAESLRVGRKTSEKGIIERIDRTPRTLIYVSDIAGQKIKSEILKSEENPYSRGFIVDVDVETVDGKPKLYRVLNLHEIIDLDDS